MKMWSLQIQQFILFIALSCDLCAAGPITVVGYEGRETGVSCSYPAGYEGYEKYLCKDDCHEEDVLITTTEATKTRYSITDDKQRRIFTTTISDLRMTDVRTYWCGVSRNGKDIYTEVKLKVSKDSCCDQTTTVLTYEDSVSLSCVYKSQDQNKKKYFCRGKQPSTCLQHALITSDNKQTGKFSLTDNKAAGNFTVTITHLSLSDSGSYLCGVQRDSGLDVFSAVELEVREWCCVNSTELRGTVGLPVILHCPYPPEHRDNRKFLCKGDQRKNCVDIVTSRSRFSLQDDVNTNTFMVRVSELKAEDAGTYWCGSEPHWTVGDYVKIHLSIDFPQQTSTVVEPTAQTYPPTPGKPVKDFPQQTSTVVEPTAQTYPPTPGKPVKDTRPFLYVVLTVPTVLLLLIISYVIYKYKCCKVQGAEVIMNRNKPKKAEADEQLYGNQEVVARSQQMTSKQCSTHDQHHNAGEDQQDSVYQNFTTDGIYCNETYIKHAKR